jgi:hypothetical protein
MSLHLRQSSLPSRVTLLFSLFVFCLGTCAGLRAQPATKPPSSAAEAKQKLAPLFLQQSELTKEKNWAQLEVVQRQIVELARVGHGPNSNALSQFMLGLAMTLVRQEQFAEAEQVGREGLAIRRKVELKQGENWVIPNGENTFAEILIAGKKFAEAETLLLSAYAATNHPNPDSHEISNLKNTTKLLVSLYQATAQPEKAAEWKRLNDEAVAAAKKK